MKRFLAVCACLASVAASLRAAEFKFGGQAITAPDGFEVERVAGPPLVDRPIEADFDEQGRLYVTDSSGSNDKPDKQLQEKPHRIVRLEDTDGDGVYDKSIVFADKMMFPEGAMWHDGSLYVAAPPSIWKLTDTDGDGIADKREEWFQGKTLTGCANDLHGPYLGLDGWIYWTKGAFARQTYERPGQTPLVTRAAHIFRCRIDGTGLEPVMTGGMDNPVGLAFTASGERIFSTTFFQQPAGGKRDGLVHAVYGGVYGKQHDVLDDHQRTGDLMPVLTHLGPAAPAGLMRYKSAVFGDAYANNLFAALFNLHKVTRHVLVREGATFRTQDSDFVVCDSTDFHPTDVLEDADGSLLVIDTGGWYKLCCPTSQLYKPDVLGAIYRVRKRGARISDPRGMKIEWSKARPDELVKLLGDPRPAVQERAVHELSKRTEKAVPPLRRVVKQREATTLQKLNAVWALTRIDAPAAREAVRLGLRDSNETVRAAAIHSISVWRESTAVRPLLEHLCRDPSIHVRRVAAEALGRLGSPAISAQPILNEAAKAEDRVFEHSLLYALIEMGDASAALAALTAEDPRLRRAALIVADQINGALLKPDAVAANLRSTSRPLRERAEWIISRHPEWGDTMLPYFESAFKDTNATDARMDQLSRLLKSFSSRPGIQTLLAEISADAQYPKRSRLSALRSMAQSGLKELPAAWRMQLEKLLAVSDSEIAGLAVGVARAVPAGKDSGFSPALVRLAQTPSNSTQLRLDALAALPGGHELDAPLFEFVTDHLTPAHPVSVRSTSVSILSKAKLTLAQLTGLADLLKDVSPLEAPKILALFAKTTNETVGGKLIENLKASPVLLALPFETIRVCLTNFPAALQEEAQGLFASNGVGARDRLEQLHAELPQGDVRRGQALFNSPRTACSACHTIGYLGGNLGPDLTRIGQIRTERDLLEAVVYPSASFVRSYEPMVVVTKSGDQFSGVLRKDSPEEIILGTGPDAEARVARTDLAQMYPGTISVMPEGLDQQLSRQELADLLTFLKATRW
jgi:putative membrane-bound dehydrogenase-like protein